MTYTIDEIKQKIIPIAKKYEIPRIYLFGSYARNEATENSDVDLLIDREHSKAIGLKFNTMFHEFQDSFQNHFDLVTLQSLNTPTITIRNPNFREKVLKEHVLIYEK